MMVARFHGLTASRHARTVFLVGLVSVWVATPQIDTTARAAERASAVRPARVSLQSLLEVTAIAGMSVAVGPIHAGGASASIAAPEGLLLLDLHGEAPTLAGTLTFHNGLHPGRFPFALARKS